MVALNSLGTPKTCYLQEVDRYKDSSLALGVPVGRVGVQVALQPSFLSCVQGALLGPPYTLGQLPGQGSMLPPYSC